MMHDLVKKKYLLGICFKLLNCFLFSILSLVILYCSTKLPVRQVLFTRVFLGSIVCFIYLLIIKEKITFKLSKKDLIFYLSRAVISFAAMQLWVYAMRYLGINEATALSYTGPFWVFMAARYMIGEAFSLRSLVAILGNMIGVIIILKPNLDIISWQGFAASLGSILLWVLYETICKKQTANQHYMLQTFYVCFFASIIISPFAIQEWQFIDYKTWGILLILSILGVANVTVIFLAYYFAPMIVISPFSYARLVFTAILTALVSNIIPSANVFVGSAIIMAINFYLAYIVNKESSTNQA
jgi:drug/metabolite transporter (DMT)-like permease